MIGKDAVLEYLRGKMATVRQSGDRWQIFAELGDCPDRFAGRAWHPCVLMAQGDRDVVSALVLFTIRDGRIVRIGLCTVLPDPASARRSGMHPRGNEQR